MCDVEETCDGSSAACPEDGKHPASEVCRPSAGACDVEETCDGVADDCPADSFEADGTSCGDDLVCNGAETCMAGTCTNASPMGCDDGDPCTVDTCSEPDGCTHVTAPTCRDAGVDAGPEPEPMTGCGCRAASGVGPRPSLAVGLAVLLWVLGRRRRRATAQEQ